MIGFFWVIALLGLFYLLVRSLAIQVSFPTSSVAPEGAIVLYKGVGGFVEVVGESNFQPALRSARASAKKVDGRLMFWATIEPENDNPHDENAVVIKFGTEKLGYLRKGDAKAFRESYAEAISTGSPIVLRGILTGGTSGKPNIGLMLDFVLHTQKTYKSKGIAL